MSMNLLRNIPLAAAVLVAGSAFAGMDQESRTSQLEQQMSQVRTETKNGTYGANTAAGSPQVDGYGLDLSLDILYWRSEVEGTEYTITDNIGTQSIPWQGSMKNVGTSWDWGFRVGVGYNFEHDNWDAQLQYTYFNNTFSSTTQAGTNDALTTLRAVPWIVSGDASTPSTYVNSAERATSEFNLWFNNLDLTLGRNYFVSSCLALRPFIAVQTAWMDLKQNTQYSGGTTGAVHIGANTIILQEKSDFWGMGPEFGMSSRWVLGNGISFFGLLQGALLYGNFDVSYKSWFSPNTTQNYVGINGDVHGFVPNARFNLGLRYDTYMEKNTQHLSIALGYDSQYWWGINQMLNFESQREFTYRNADIGMQGVTLDIRWDF